MKEKLFHLYSRYSLETDSENSRGLFFFTRSAWNKTLPLLLAFGPKKQYFFSSIQDKDKNSIHYT